MGKGLIIGLCLLLSIGSAKSQVTIGSGIAPNKGALLDLKQEEKTDGSANSSKGIMLPRVKLSDMDKLQMGTTLIQDVDNGGNQHAKHAGLVVYNISGAQIPKCAPIPDGIYIWDGVKWEGIGVEKVDPATLTISSSNIDFPSGQDLRTMPTTPTSFTVDWTPSDNPVTYTNEPHATWGGISFNGANTPLANGNLTTSPTTFSLLPDAMTADDIDPTKPNGNLFRTKQNTLTFKVANECGADITEIRVINQTNKALTLQTPFKEATVNSSETNDIKSNAQWKLKSIVPNDNTNAIFTADGVSTLKLDGTNLTTGTTQGTELKNNSYKENATDPDSKLSYTITVDATKARYSVLTFEDAAPAKRFSDVTLTILQCTNVGQHPTIEQWALSAGFTQQEIDAVKSTGADSRKLANGLQMHRVKDTPRGTNQIFLSSNFGANPQNDDERWMIHNLDATAYDGVTHPDRELSGPNRNSGDSYNTAYWVYPSNLTNPSTYNNNERLGLLYTWDAATAGKGGKSGTANLGNESGQPPSAANKIQGICPSGWHLPSDYDWTVLENRFISNTNDFSSTANIGGTLLNPAEVTTTSNQGRGTHGKSMKEVCEPSDAIKTHQGTSNGIGAWARPGFEVFLAGRAYSGSAVNYQSLACFWLASSYASASAWYRDLSSNNSQVVRGYANRYYLFSVRCKKD